MEGGERELLGEGRCMRHAPIRVRREIFRGKSQAAHVSQVKDATEADPELGQAAPSGGLRAASTEVSDRLAQTCPCRQAEIQGAPNGARRILCPGPVIAP